MVRKRLPVLRRKKASNKKNSNDGRECHPPPQNSMRNWRHIAWPWSALQGDIWISEEACHARNCGRATQLTNRPASLKKNKQEKGREERDPTAGPDSRGHEGYGVLYSNGNDNVITTRCSAPGHVNANLSNSWSSVRNEDQTSTAY